MAYDALQGRPLPDVAEQPVSPSAAAAAAAAAAGSGGLPSAQQQPLPPPPGSAERAAPLSVMEVEAQIAKFKVPHSTYCKCGRLHTPACAPDPLLSSGDHCYSPMLASTR